MLKLWFLSMILVACCILSVGASDQVPGARAPQDHPIALVGGTIHPVSGPTIEGGVLLFDGGQIVDIGDDVTLPEGAERIDVTGKHVLVFWSH